MNNDFPSSINSPNKRTSGFAGSLFDDMDASPFVYKDHYQNYLNNLYTRKPGIDPFSFSRHTKLWPNIYEDVYKGTGKVGNFYFDKQTGEILSNGRFPTPLEGTLRSSSRERIRIPKAETKSKGNWRNEFIDQLKKGNWKSKFKSFETYAGGAIGSFVANRSWKWLTGLGVAGTATLATGMYSSRKTNPNDDRKRQ